MICAIKSMNFENTFSSSLKDIPDIVKLFINTAIGLALSLKLKSMTAFTLNPIYLLIIAVSSMQEDVYALFAIQCLCLHRNTHELRNS